MNITVDLEDSKYTRTEYERRFLVSSNADWRRFVESYSKTYEDRYLRGTRLRLRVLTDLDTGRRVLKLNRKSVSPSPYSRVVSRILLAPGEHALLESLPGDPLKKIRYYHNYGGRVFSIDVFEGELEGLILCETEAMGLEELMSVEPPPYATLEVTEDPFFEGGNLSRTSHADLIFKISPIG